jgi:hypothetical protein
VSAGSLPIACLKVSSSASGVWSPFSTVVIASWLSEIAYHPSSSWRVTALSPPESLAFSFWTSASNFAGSSGFVSPTTRVDFSVPAEAIARSTSGPSAGLTSLS